MRTLEGKVAVITGGTRGFGLAIAEAYIREGARVVVASRSEHAVENAITQLNVSNEVSSGFACDVNDFEQVRALKQHALNTFEKLDVWINNAGISGPYGPTAHLTPETFKNVLHTNIFGTYHGSWVAMQHFVPQGHGKLINILGRGDKKPTPLQNAYGSTKAWIRSFTTALAEEYEESGVGVYAYNPGMMATDLLTRLDAIEGFENRLKAMPTIIRMWTVPPETSAQKVVWLGSTATDGRTGLVSWQTNMGFMLKGALIEGLRRLFRRSAPSVEIEINSVPSALHLEK